jgi:hypothetical protein
MTRRGVRPPPPPQRGGSTPSSLGRGNSGGVPSGLLPTCLLLPPARRSRLPLRPGCGGSDSGRGAAAPSLLVLAAEAEAGDPAAVWRLPPYSRGGPCSRRSCRGEVAADQAVRPACGGGGVTGVGNGGPAAGGGVVVAWRRRALACLAFFLFFSFFCAVSIWVAHGKERVTPSRCGTAVDPFSLPCATFCVRQRPTPCVAFPNGARQRSLPGKNAPCALCHAPGQNPHGKGCAVWVLAFGVAHGKACESGSVVAARDLIYTTNAGHLCRSQIICVFP